MTQGIRDGFLFGELMQNIAVIFINELKQFDFVNASLVIPSVFASLRFDQSEQIGASRNYQLHFASDIMINVNSQGWHGNV